MPKFTVEIEDITDLDADFFGELLLYLFNPSERFGYSTREFNKECRVEKIKPDIKEDLKELTICLGSEAKLEYSRVDKWVVKIGDSEIVEVFLYWDGDGVIVITDSVFDEWTVFNTDIKKGYWEWLTPDSWVYDVIRCDDYDKE